MEDIGGTRGLARGGTIGNVKYSTVGRRRGEAGRPLGTERSDGERQRIDQRAILEEAAKVVAGTAMATTAAMEATNMTEGGWEDPPATLSTARRPLLYPIFFVYVDWEDEALCHAAVQGDLLHAQCVGGSRSGG